jgi:hypothetical protein
MHRCTPFCLACLALALAAPLLAFGQEQAPSRPKSADPQTTPDSKDKPRDNSNVVILKAPEMPAQPQFKPELRAVDLEKRKQVDEATRMHLIQLMDAEFGHVRKYVPLGDKTLVIDPQGRVTPNDVSLFQLTQARGTAAKVGDKVQVTNVVFHEKSIYFEINGGPKKKTKWYQHISVGVGGGGGSVTPINGEEAQPTGAAFTLQFGKPVPEMTLDELKKLLSPVIDFSEKSAIEVYTETLPPKIRDAIKNHEVLVGMNRDMVIMAKDRPEQKVREKDDNGKEYEDWIYGKLPHDVVFVRLVGDEVTMVKIAKVAGQVIVKTEKEVDVKDGVASLAALKAGASAQEASRHEEEPQQPARKPTLRREGEEAEPTLQLPTNGQNQPAHPAEPDWGTGGKPAEKQPPPPQDPQKPPQF